MAFKRKLSKFQNKCISRNKKVKKRLFQGS